MAGNTSKKSKEGDEADDRSAPASSPNDDKPALTPSRRMGRRVAAGIYYATMAAIAVASLVQITRQVFFPQQPSSPAPFSTCVDGLRELYQAIERGGPGAAPPPPPRAAETPDAQGERNEEAALLRYRSAVTPTWQHRNAVARLCANDRSHRESLDAIERLRYSEEHGVRHQAAELTALRRRVQKLVKKRLSVTPTGK